MAPILEVRGLWKSYRAGIAGCRAHVRVLQDASLTLHAGERLLVIGAPSAGKSTLMLCLAGLRRPDDGEIRWSDAVGSRSDWWRLRSESAADAARRSGAWPVLVDLGTVPADERWLAALAGGPSSRGWLVVARHAGALAALADSVLELHEGALRPVRAAARVRRVAEGKRVAPLTLGPRRL